jgi:hypothetical protein
MRDFNDRWSPISTMGPAVVSVYEHYIDQGPLWTFRASDPWLRNNLIGNDSISSFRVGARCP